MPIIIPEPVPAWTGGAGVIAPNAVLTKVAGTGTSDDWDSPAGVDATKWSGTADVRVHQHIETVADTVRQTDAPRLDVLGVTEMVAPRDVAELVTVGDTVTYSWDGTTYSRDVIQTRPRDIGWTVRLWLKNA